MFCHRSPPARSPRQPSRGQSCPVQGATVSRSSSAARIYGVIGISLAMVVVTKLCRGGVGTVRGRLSGTVVPKVGPSAAVGQAAGEKMGLGGGEPGEAAGDRCWGHSCGGVLWKWCDWDLGPHQLCTLALKNHSFLLSFVSGENWNVIVLHVTWASFCGSHESFVSQQISLVRSSLTSPFTYGVKGWPGGTPSFLC